MVVLMRRVFKLPLPFQKPEDISDDVWIRYHANGEYARFWKLYAVKTIFVTVSVTFGLNLILNETLDLFLNNPQNHSPRTSLITVILGVVCLVCSFIIVFVIDKTEEYKRLKELERKHQAHKLEKRRENKMIENLSNKVEQEFLTKEELQEYIDERIKTNSNDIK
jgi:ABC-type multidrug transport system fused ATPase/permease subunit